MPELNDHASREHALLSASSAHRWLHCPPSAVAAEAYPQTSTDFTREGTIAHEVAEHCARVALDGHSSPTLETFIMQEGVDAEMVDCGKGYGVYLCELRTGEHDLDILETRVDFSPWVPNGFGTADAILIHDDGVMDVIDYKYGKGVLVSADHNPQEMLYGLGALNDYGFAYDVRTVRLHIYQPRMNNISVYEMPASELLAWGEGIKKTAEAAAKGKGKYAAGEWCRFCPHAGKCRELTKVCTTYVETHGAKYGVPQLAPHEIADVLAMESTVTLWLKRVHDQAVTSLLNGEEIPGYKVVAGRSARAWSDELRVVESLKTAGVPEDALFKTEVLSVAAMEKSIGKKRVGELVGDLITTTQGAPTVAPESDKRPVYNRLEQAVKDFGDN